MCHVMFCIVCVCSHLSFNITQSIQLAHVPFLPTIKWARQKDVLYILLWYPAFKLAYYDHS